MSRSIGALFFLPLCVLSGCGENSDPRSVLNSVQHQSQNKDNLGKKTLNCKCHGGPGNYPYDCEVCPE